MVYQMAATASSNSQYMFSASSPILEAKILTVQMDIHQCYAAAGLTYPRCKQKFGEMEGGPTTETDGDTSTSNNEAAAAHADDNPNTSQTLE
jgi:hypothetical protein